jgi:hypothetical protein
MTENKLRKFISKPREPPSGKRTHQPIILTDSKGNYLKKYACHDVEKQIVWLPKSGGKIEDSTQWLKNARHFGTGTIRHQNTSAPV